MSARLQSELEVLRSALGAYLERLHAHWEPGAGDVERIVAAVGAQAEPPPQEVARLRALLDAAPGEGDRLAALDLDAGEALLVAAAWWAEADPQFALLLGCAHDDGTRRFPSAALLRLALAPFGVAVPGALDDGHPLVTSGVLEPGAGATEPLRLTATARALLAGGAPAPLSAPRPAPPRLAPAVQALARHLAGAAPQPVLLRGVPGVGRRGVAVDAACAAGLTPIAADRPAGELRLLTRLAAAVVVAPAAAAEALGWTAADGPLVAWGGAREHLADAYVVDLPAPSHAQRAELWRAALGRLGLAAADDLAAALAARFAFTEGDVTAVAARAALDAAWLQRPVDRTAVWEAARRQPEHVLERLATLVAPAFSLADLVLDEETDAKLRELVAHVALQHVVLDGWGFRRRLPRGQGVAALFSGPSGTGKTTAAEALAGELGQDLYRIDLSAVVSKYVGETEKNLAVAFDEAERGSAVLFFDEADALFGKRTGVRDAHDRYANLEINFLLQRVETFTGLVILASNRAAAIDEAFLRRLRFTIRFEPPDRALRVRLWRRSFPPGARVAALDWDTLAAVELAGGSIQSAALAAAYLAAADGGTITPAHVDHALRREHQKLGKAWVGA